MQMGRRQITMQQVGELIANPGQVVDVWPGRKIYQGRMTVGGKGYLLRVVADIYRSPAEIVTVYRTSKIGKYWR